MERLFYRDDADREAVRAEEMAMLRDCIYFGGSAVSDAKIAIELGDLIDGFYLSKLWQRYLKQIY